MLSQREALFGAWTMERGAKSMKWIWNFNRRTTTSKNGPGEKGGLGRLFGAWTIFSGAAAQKKEEKKKGATEQLSPLQEPTFWRALRSRDRHPLSDTNPPDSIARAATPQQNSTTPAFTNRVEPHKKYPNYLCTTKLGCFLRPC